MSVKYKKLENNVIVDIALFADDADGQALAQERGYVLASDDDEVSYTAVNMTLTEVRHHRDLKLAASDYTQLADITDSMLPGTKSEWATYRQKLRDITDNIDLSNIDWPEEPRG
mgnify:FL=1